MQCSSCSATHMHDNTCNAVYMQSRQPMPGNPCGATHAMQPMQCSPCNATYAMQPMQCNYC